jgi:WD40 repeat protein
MCSCLTYSDLLIDMCCSGCMHLSPKGDCVVVAKKDFYDIYNISSGVVSATLTHKVGEYPWWSVRFVHGGYGVFGSYALGEIRLWDPETNTKLHTIGERGELMPLKHHRSPPDSLARCGTFLCS